jgi:hypothetical protein
MAAATTVFRLIGFRFFFFFGFSVGVDYETQLWSGELPIEI